jgi:hypothetical protein
MKTIGYSIDEFEAVGLMINGFSGYAPITI